jgi:predicted metal-dependent phosphoesterase TrpH
MNFKKRWLKAELHAHCNLDPHDHKVCDYSAEQLIAEAARLHYDVLAITCHNLDVWTRDLSDYAHSHGITLIPGMEVAANGLQHVLAYNFRMGCENLNTLAKIGRHSRSDTMVIAPHPFFPGPCCLGNCIEDDIGIFDAIESSGFYLRNLDFNRRARMLALKYDKPVVGSADVHYLWQMGKTFTWIYSEPDVLPVIQAVKQGSVRVQSTPLSCLEVASWWTIGLWRTVFGSKPTPNAGSAIPENF